MTGSDLKRSDFKAARVVFYLCFSDDTYPTTQPRLAKLTEIIELSLLQIPEIMQQPPFGAIEETSKAWTDK